MSLKSNLLVAAATMLVMAPLSAHAHMIMANPVPYGSPNNSPLDPSGSDFPCKTVPYTVNTMNDWKVGSTQTLSFTGTAVHGGGSCQISVTSDKEPTKDSKWKVIHSIEGGCPAAVDGNLDENGPNSDATFPFTIPSELPNGEMTMAMTWFNRIGNREMYMNCAPITVSDGSDDTAAFEALPDMAVANIGVGSCTTSEGSDFSFENPGQYVTNGGKGSLVPLCGGVPAAGGSGEGAGAPAPAPAPANPGASSAALISSQAQVAPSSAGITQSTLRTIKTVTAPMASAPSTTNTGGVPAPSASGKPAPSAAPAPAPSSGAGTSNGTSCSPDGAVVCSPDGTQFAICNFGTAAFQPVASGTKCTNGAIVKRDDYSHRNQRTVL